MAVDVATGVTAGGERVIFGLNLSYSEDEIFWRSCRLSHNQRGLSGVRLVISGQHSCLVKALGRAVERVTQQRCRLRFAGDLLAHVPKGQADLAASAFPMIFA